MKLNKLKHVKKNKSSLHNYTYISLVKNYTYISLVKNLSGKGFVEG
jgi:hypothetical protein